MNADNPHEVALQDEWLRRISRALVRDPDLASDLVQDAWVASLSRDRADRPWLGGVLRHTASAFFRRRSRREERERDAARAPTSPPQDEVSEQLELRARVAQELGLLEEPFRTAIYLRFVEGLSVRETARRLDVAGSTVVARVEKGLSRLRQRLDESHGGDRRQWSLLLLPWARRVAPVLSLPVSLTAMIAVTTTTLAAALFLAGIPPLTSTGSVPGSLGPAVGLAAPAPALSLAPAPASEPWLPPTVPGARQPLPSATVAEPSRLPAPAVAAVSEDSHLRARLLLPDGSPAAQIPWTLGGRAANQQLALEYGTPADWSDPTGFTDEQGWIEVDFASHPAHAYSLTVDHPDYVREYWQWEGIRPGETKVVQDTVLRLPGAVRGTVVDEAGTPLTARSWRIHARESSGRFNLGRQHAAERVTTATEGGDAGRFAFDRLPGGVVTLRLDDPNFGSVDGPTVTVVAGETLEVDFTLPGYAEGLRSIVVGMQSKSFGWSAAPSPEQVWLVGPSGDRRHARALHGRWSSYVFEDVAPGMHRVEVEGPGLRPWFQEGVTAGSFVQADLVGSAGLLLEVTGLGGEPVEVDTVDVQTDDFHGEALHSASPSRFRLDVGTGGLVEGLLPGDYLLTVRHGILQQSVTVSGLAANEQRGISVALAETPVVRGCVRYPNGEPAAGVMVRAVEPAAIDDSPASFIIDQMSMTTNVELARQQISRTMTDEQGAFALALGEAPGHIVVVGRRPGHQVESGLLVTAPATSMGVLDFEIQPSAFLSGAVRLPEGLVVNDWLVLFVEDEPPFPPFTHYAYVDEDGSFDFGARQAAAGTLVLLPSRSMGLESGVIPADGRTLGRAVLEPGGSFHESFDYPGATPVATRFTLTGAGPGAPGESRSIWVTRRAPGPSGWATTTGSTLGPIALEPGLHDAWVVGKDFVAQPRGLVVPEDDPARSGPAEVAIDLALSTRRVRAMLGDSPLANTTLEQTNLPQGARSVRYTTDADGYFDIRLGPGTYYLHERRTDISRLRVSTLQWPPAEGKETLDFQPL